MFLFANGMEGARNETKKQQQKNAYKIEGNRDRNKNITKRGAKNG